MKKKSTIFSILSIIIFVFSIVGLLAGPVIIGEKAGEECAGVIDDVVHRYYPVDSWKDEDDYTLDYINNSKVEEEKIENELKSIKGFEKTITVWDEIKIVSSYMYFSHDLESGKQKYFSYMVTVRVIFIILCMLMVLYGVISSILQIVKILKNKETIKSATNSLNIMLFMLIPFISIGNFFSMVENTTVAASVWMILLSIIVISLIGNICAFIEGLDDAENIIEYFIKKGCALGVVLFSIAGMGLLSSNIVDMGSRSGLQANVYLLNGLYNESIISGRIAVMEEKEDEGEEYDGYLWHDDRKGLEDYDRQEYYQKQTLAGVIISVMGIMLIAVFCLASNSLYSDKNIFAIILSGICILLSCIAFIAVRRIIHLGISDNVIYNGNVDGDFYSYMYSGITLILIILVQIGIIVTKYIESYLRKRLNINSKQPA